MTAIASPLLYVAIGQLSGIAPFEIAGKTSTNVQIVSGAMKSPVVAVSVIPAGVPSFLYNPLVISAGGATSAGWTTIAVQ